MCVRERERVSEKERESTESQIFKANASSKMKREMGVKIGSLSSFEKKTAFEASFQPKLPALIVLPSRSCCDLSALVL